MLLKDADWIANSADSDQTSSRSSLIWVCSVCPGISVQKLRIIPEITKESCCMLVIQLMSQSMTKSTKCLAPSENSDLSESSLGVLHVANDPRTAMSLICMWTAVQIDWVFAGHTCHFLGIALLLLTLQLSHLMTKPTKWHVRPAKTQISLGLRPVWSESLLSAWRKLGFLATHWVHSEDSDQTWPAQSDQSLRWVHIILLLLSCGGSVSRSHITRKHVFGGFQPGWTQTSLLHRLFKMQV